MSKFSKFYDVSIVISVTDYHWEHAAQNVILTRRQNPDVNIQWILVANNHAPDFPIPESVLRNPTVEIVDGFPFSDFENAPRPGSASLAAGMRRGFEFVRSRYVIQMDSDFYAIRFKWISDVLREMKRRDLTFWGVPWDIKRKEKWRSFPCSHLTVFDTKNIPLDEISFETRYLPYLEYFAVPPILKNSLYIEHLKRENEKRAQNILNTKTHRDHFNKKFRDAKNSNQGAEPASQTECLEEVRSLQNKIRKRSFANDYRSWVPSADMRSKWWRQSKTENLEFAKQIAERFFMRDIQCKNGSFAPERPFENRVLRLEQSLDALEAMHAQVSQAIADFSSYVSDGSWKSRTADKILRIVEKSPKKIQEIFWSFYEYNIVNRAQIGTTGDLNIDIREKAEKEGLKADTCQISLRASEFTYSRAWPAKKKLRFWSRYVFEQLIPVRYSLIPLRHASVTSKRFKDLGLPDFRDLGWEEYFWRKEPFAVHIRTTARRTGLAQEQIQEIWLKNFLEQAVCQPIETRNSLDQGDSTNARHSRRWQPNRVVPASVAKSDSEELRKFRNCEAGKRIFVVANGPSLTAEDLEMIKDEVSIACNKTWLLYEHTNWRPTYYFVEDTMVIQQNKEEISNLTGSIKFFPQRTPQIGVGLVPSERPFTQCHYYPFDIPNWRQGIPPHDKWFSSDVSKMVYGGGTVLYSMFQFANYFGAKEVILIGCDHKFQTSKETPLVWLDLEVGRPLRSTELHYFLLRNGHREVKKSEQELSGLKFPGEFFSKSDTFFIFPRLDENIVEVRLTSDDYVQSIAILSKDRAERCYCRSYTLGGVEVVSRGKGNHFAKGYRQPGEKWGSPNMWLTTNLIQKAGQSIEMNGGRLLNATRGGELEVLPRVDFETLF